MNAEQQRKLALAEKRTAALVAATPKRLPSGERYELHQGEYQRAVISDASLDYIISEPPADESFVRSVQPFADWASRKLKPGASLLLICGPRYQYELMRGLAKHLTYWWLGLRKLHESEWVYHDSVRIIQQGKSVLHFKNGRFKTGIWSSDVVDSDLRVITNWTRPGAVVCDPFMDAGTFGVACLESLRLFIGIETQEAKLAEAQARLALTAEHCKHTFQTCGCVLLDLADGMPASPLHSCRPHALEIQKEKQKERSRLKRLAEKTDSRSGELFAESAC